MDVPDTKYARNGDVHIAYQSFGEGDNVFVGIPPIISNIEVIWDNPEARSFFTRLASFCRVVHYDKRGQGLSDRDTGVPTIDDRIGDLAAVLDAEGIENAALGGISEGGSTAALFAATFPNRVSKLVLFAAPVRLLSAPDFFQKVSDDVIDALFESWAANWGTPQTLSVALVTPSMLGDDRYLRWMNRYERQSTSPGGLLAAYQWIRQIDIRQILPSVQCPTLLMHRIGDPLVNVAHSRLSASLIPHAELVELEGIDHVPWQGDQDIVLERLEAFLTGASHARQRSERVLATVLFTDIVGSTERAASVGDLAWRGVLERHDDIAARQVSLSTGTLVKSTGDGMLARFDGPARALHCALELRDELSAVGVPIRVGLHTGEIELRGDDVGGIAVHIAARVEAKATAGEVLVTRTVKDLVAGSGATFEPRGTHTLKGVPDEWQLYSVLHA